MRANVDLEDKIMSLLLSYGEQEIRITIDEMVGKTGLKGTQIYQKLYRMKEQGRLSILTEKQSSGHMKIVGIRLFRSEYSAPEVKQRVTNGEVKRKTEAKMHKFQSDIPETFKYANKKLGIEEAKKVLLDHGLSGAELVFTPEPLGEECLLMLQKIEEVAADREEWKMRALVAERENEILKAKGVTVAQRQDEVSVSAGSHI